MLRLLKETQTSLARKLQLGAAVIFATLLLLVYLYTAFVLRHDPTLTDLSIRLQGPSLNHPLGTDHLGRDVLTRLMLGGQQTIGYSLLALAAALLIGTAAGMVAGYRGGWLDRVFMRIADGFLAFPDMIVVIVLSGLLGPGLHSMIIAIVMVKWVSYARVVRTTVITESKQDYMLAARTNGLSPARMLTRHLLPHIAGQVLVLASLDLGKVILLISSLSYIGLGVQPPTPEWGAMLNDSRPYFQLAPELMLFPGLAIVLVVLCFTVLGDSIRDLYDVKKEVRG
ncbi:nickel transporter permease [Paenibacillus typhae]|uniref:nickel transporter permease n=1 Tax=Paenibacillus typhae TaxID=1174501 RepID=UPI001C8EAC88|nr:nickel transporter permease [Paenibacillus typhae]MBY0011203.1 ABC transporter permease subunit [Paenibacillus typhae]